MKMDSWINIKGVQKHRDALLLGTIDLNNEPGTITALVGNNGSGKSTLFKMIMNLVNYDKGDIKVFNKHVNNGDESWKKEIAYQPQTTIGYDAFTGNQLKELISEWYPNWDDELFKRLTELFDIPLTKLHGKLYQGTQQKLTLALTIDRKSVV